MPTMEEQGSEKGLRKLHYKLVDALRATRHRHQDEGPLAQEDDVAHARLNGAKHVAHVDHVGDHGLHHSHYSCQLVLISMMTKDGLASLGQNENVLAFVLPLWTLGNVLVAYLKV